MLSFKSVTAKVNAVAIAVATFLAANPDVRHELLAHVPPAYQALAVLVFGLLVQFTAEHDRAAAPPSGN